MSRPFIDSNVILYLLSADSTKADKAEAVIAAGGVISVQVLNEVTAVCRRKLEMPWPEIDILLRAVKSSCEVTPLTITTHEAAISIARDYGLAFYDANIWASATLAGAQVLFSEDMQDGMCIHGTTLCNPFH